MAGNHTLAWIDAVTGQRHRVLRVPKRFESIDAISWSPDGTRLAFSTHTLRGGVPPQIEPVLVLVFQIVFSLVNLPYMQDHMNRIWGHSSGAQPLPGGAPGALPSPPAS